MKTWRERILEGKARQERGLDAFLEKDFQDSSNAKKCVWGELNKTYGLGLKVVKRDSAFVLSENFWKFEDEKIEDLGCDFNSAIGCQSPDRALMYLEQFEDQALKMKRKRGSKNAQ